MYLSNTPAVEIEAMCKKMKSPRGVFIFICSRGNMFDKMSKPLRVLELIAGAHYFRIDRDSNLNMHFVHSSPGTGTRCASVNIAPLVGSTELLIEILWCPNEIRLRVANPEDKQSTIEGKGRPSQRQFRVTHDGSVVQIGDVGVDVFSYEIIANGQVLRPVALEGWKSTVECSKWLLKGFTPENHSHETVCTAAVVSMLVTGLEVYGKRRFLEVEDEGITPNFDKLSRRFLRKRERQMRLDEILRIAKRRNTSPTKILLCHMKKVNFQNYDDCRLAFNYAYGIVFGEDLNLPNTHLEEVQLIIRFRHRVIHISPLQATVNEKPSPNPIFPDFAFANQAIETINGFVCALHTATLALRP